MKPVRKKEDGEDVIETLLYILNGVMGSATNDSGELANDKSVEDLNNSSDIRATMFTSKITQAIDKAK